MYPSATGRVASPRDRRIGFSHPLHPFLSVFIRFIKIFLKSHPETSEVAH